jgi:NADP-dependent 3-hydroxy acid dehydrogenase YdfG
MVARTAAPLEELQRRHPQRAVAVPGNVADSSVAERAVAAALGAWDRVDGLVLNHGVLTAERVADSSAAEWARVFGVNYLSSVEFVSLQKMKRKKKNSN